MMSKFTDTLEQKVLPVAQKLAGQRHLIAIRDGFMAMISLTMVSSLATLLISLPIPALQDFLANDGFGKQITELCQNISWGAFSFMSIFACFAIAQSLWHSYGHKGLEGGLISVAVFITASKQTVPYLPEPDGKEVLVPGGLASVNFGATALFTALILSILTIEVLHRLTKVKWLSIKLPDMVPPAVARSFEVLFPGIFTLLFFAIILLILRNLSGSYLPDLITKLVQTPIQSVTDTIGSAIVYPLLVGLLWSIGVHGSNVVNGIASPILASLSAQNMQLASEGAKSGYHIITGPFFPAFVWLGGAGATLALIVAIFIAGRKERERYKAITSLAVGPGLFNINEPVIFGMPIILNPVLMVPFILIPIVLSVISYFAIAVGWVAPTIVQEVNWTTPFFLAGYLATGHISGAVLSTVNFILAVIMYLPFVKLSIKVDEAHKQKTA